MTGFTDDDCQDVYDTYATNPLGFKNDCLKSATFEPEQARVFKALFDNPRVAVSSCHNFGKSFILANAVHTAINIYAPEIIIITTAPTYRQVKSVLWAEIRKIYVNTNADGQTLGGKMNLTEYKISDKWFAIGFAPRKSTDGIDPSVFQGLHAKTVIIIFDEATGVPKSLWDSAEGMLTSAGQVFFWAIANPTDTTAEFYRKTKAFGWKYIKITCFDTPNLQANGIRSLKDIRSEANKIRKMVDDTARLKYLASYKVVNPYLLSTRWVIEKYLDWGEQSPLFMSKVIGEFPITTTNTLVPLKRMDEISLGSYIDEQGARVWESELQGYAHWNGDRTLYVGVDVAREGDDKTVVYALEGNREFYKKEYPKTYVDTAKGTKLLENSTYIAGEIKRDIIDANPDRAVKINIDTTGGYGDGVYDALNDDESIVNNILVSIVRTNFAELATNTEKYTNRVSEIWIETAKDIMSDEGILFEPDDDIKSEFTTRTKDFERSKLRERIEPKELFKKRNGRSPDKTDAVCLANGIRRNTVANRRGSWKALQERADTRKGKGSDAEPMKQVGGVYVRK